MGVFRWCIVELLFNNELMLNGDKIFFSIWVL